MTANILIDNAKRHWKILHRLGNDLANRVRLFMVIDRKGEGVMVTTEDGEGYWLGKMWLGSNCWTNVTEPTLLDVPDPIQMAHGYEHILLLNKRGEIYSIGPNHFGQLGLGTTDYETHYSPQLIPSPFKFTSVRCGLYHSLALTEDGKVCAWGENRSFQVGVEVNSTNNSVPSPRKILEFDSHRVVAVECGGRHSLALTDLGVVYAWGRNDYGQLGDGSEINNLYQRYRMFQHTPTKIPTPSPVQSIAAGVNHTLLLTQTGEVYACGYNGWGQLGLPRTTSFSPRLSKVAGLPPISQIASHFGTQLSIAMSLHQRCFIWGELADGTTVFSPRELAPEYSTVESPLSSFSTHRNTPHSVPDSVPETSPSRLSVRMSRMFDNPETSPDVQFVVEQRTIHAHRNILSNFSDYFARMLSERWLAPVDPEEPIVKVTISDFSYEVFHAFLRFLYTDYFNVHSDLLPEFFELASQYLVPELQQLCLWRMHASLSPTTCCLYYPLTHRHSQLPEIATFEKELVQFASTRMSEVVNSAAYQSMEPELCQNLDNAVQNITDS